MAMRGLIPQGAEVDLPLFQGCFRLRGNSQQLRRRYAAFGGRA